METQIPDRSQPEPPYLALCCLRTHSPSHGASLSHPPFLQIPPPKRADPPPPVHHEDEDPAQHSTSPGSPPPSHPLTQQPQGSTADSTDGRRSTQDLRPRHLRPRRLHPAAFLGSGFRVTHDQDTEDSTSQSPTQPPIQVNMEPEPSIQFGADVMEVVASWTKALCVDISQGRIPNHVDDVKAEASELGNKVFVLDIGTGNSLLLQELAKQGFSYLTGTDYNEGAISLAQSVANRDVFFLN
ncbi:hypothetical protein Ahy_B07g087043 isoform C [Arachis hypogaea]|uniref:Methyltransferase domain-containing protein n=1 Tax=Arachis hypogaea TaxID=3818 RepID=A0A444YB34_ARAHY|nr:hypothetical protein Ahy_B07g087043 isoform C [Arachis hypogaea]